MTADNNVRNLNHPPIHVIELYGPRGVQVIGRNADVPAIAAYGRTLPPKVARFHEVLKELKRFELARKELIKESAAQAGDLHVATVTWRTRVQIDLDGLDAEDIAITETEAADVVLANARRLIEVLEGRDAEVPDAAEARAALESKHSSATAAFEAAQGARVAVQSKQRELRALAAEVQKELVKLRKTVRLLLGSRHLDYRFLRIDKGRAAAEPPLETVTDPVPAQSGRPSAAPSNGASLPSSSG